jgi:DNA-binding GntR family transcriptional regulator
MNELDNLIQVKAALAEKCMRLAAARNSKPLKARLFRHAERFRQQVKRLNQSRLGKQART